MERQLNKSHRSLGKIERRAQAPVRHRASSEPSREKAPPSKTNSTKSDDKKPSLANQLRPDSWQGVIGQDAQVDALRELIADRTEHTFILAGPSGTGKTTLARVAAKELGATRVDIDGADYTGVEDVRTLRERISFKPFDGRPVAIVIDECHRLSAQAIDCLLTVTEEPPDWVYWFLCTTNPSKLPKTLKSRGITLMLKELTASDLAYLAEAAGEIVGLIKADVEELCLRQANGSARQLLTNIAMCAKAKDRREAAELLYTAYGVENDAAVDLCRMLADGRASWPAAMDALKKCEGLPPESVRYQVLNYLGACLRNAKSDKAAIDFLHRIQAFSTPYHSEEGQNALARSIGFALLTTP